MAETESVANNCKISALEIINNSKSLLAVFVIASFLIPFSIGSYSLRFNNQFMRMSGMAEEYLHLGITLYRTGKYQMEENKDFFFRPPGYPYFLHYALKFYGGKNDLTKKFSSLEEMQRAFHALCAYLTRVQNILFSLTVLIFFGIALQFHKQAVAFILTLLFGCNPYFFILVGLIHYEILHIFLLSSGTFFLIREHHDKSLKLVWLILSGTFFGLATLVRPITLILPLFAFIAFLLMERRKFLPSAIKTLILSLCMLIIVSPYSLRNYRLSQAFIPVNAQAGVALWSGTVKAMSIQPNHYRWWDLWYTEGMPIYKKVAGEEELTAVSWARYNLLLEKEFKKEAYANIKKQPLIYAHNVMINFISINFCMNSVFIKIFEYIQLPGKQFSKDMLKSNNHQTFQKDSLANLFNLLVAYLTFCSIIGIYLGMRRNDLSIVPVAAIYLCVTIAHSITYMDVMYYYVKLPFLFMFFAYFLKHLTTRGKRAKDHMFMGAALVFPCFLTMILLFNLIFFNGGH